MGSAASTRAKAKAKAAAAAASSSALAPGSSDVTSGTERPAKSTTNAGGDVGGNAEPSPPVADPGPGTEASAAEGNPDGKDATEDEKPAEESSSASTFSEDAGSAGNDGALPEGPPTTTTAGDQESATKTAHCVRDAACQWDLGDDPDDPISIGPDAPLPPDLVPDGPELPSAGFEEVLRSYVVDREMQQRPCGDVCPADIGKGEVSAVDDLRQQQLASGCAGGVCQVGDRNKSVVVAELHRHADAAADVSPAASITNKPRVVAVTPCPAAGDDPQQRRVDGVLPAGLDGPPPVKDDGSAAPPDWQQRRPEASEGPFPGGMEGDPKAADRQSFPAVGQVTVYEGPSPRVISVAHDGKVNDSNGLPPVSN